MQSCTRHGGCRLACMVMCIRQDFKNAPQEHQKMIPHQPGGGGFSKWQERGLRSVVALLNMQGKSRGTLSIVEVFVHP